MGAIKQQNGRLYADTCVIQIEEADGSVAVTIAPGRGEIDSLDALAPGQGAVVRQGLTKVAAYHDARGALHVRSAACTHLGCIVHWNSLERCWDCPCHGSQFGIDGVALNGPAVAPLAEAEA